MHCSTAALCRQTVKQVAPVRYLWYNAKQNLFTGKGNAVDKHLERVKDTLTQGEYTIAVENNGKIYTSDKNGIAPLLDFLKNPEILRGAAAADKVIGKAAAYLFLKGGVRELYAQLLSEPAKELLESRNVPVTYGQLVPYIKNRTQDGMCPMEQSVLEVQNEEEALQKLQETLARLKGKPVQ
ncbi:DUF1893 domain-containing protein [Caproicibacterium amylolyticum]|uniref:DUF1893 domain-containing protein n=1 Tax=Caproicibacterium amylolyticum TaxID=2766537 RepID=A0A7G9WH75_9FIRM|nr:DUF1893 domain-containing protein [Caproicibacterium amylolyticum]QNO18037.1 DUF1893 domain-containing protein [Caproicibacterium amylolyticum]